MNMEMQVNNNTETVCLSGHVRFRVYLAGCR